VISRPWSRDLSALEFILSRSQSRSRDLMAKVSVSFSRPRKVLDNNTGYMVTSNTSTQIGNFFLPAQFLHTVVCIMTIIQCFDNVCSIGWVTRKTSSSKKKLSVRWWWWLDHSVYTRGAMYFCLDFWFSPATCTITYCIKIQHGLTVWYWLTQVNLENDH